MYGLNDRLRDIVPIMNQDCCSLADLGSRAIAPGLQAQSCERLSKLASPTVSITFAKTIDSGAFTPDGSSTTISYLPAFIRRN